MRRPCKCSVLLRHVGGAWCLRRCSCVFMRTSCALPATQLALVRAFSTTSCLGAGNAVMRVARPGQVRHTSFEPLACGSCIALVECSRHRPSDCACKCQSNTHPDEAPATPAAAAASLILAVDLKCDAELLTSIGVAASRRLGCAAAGAGTAAPERPLPSVGTCYTYRLVMVTAWSHHAMPQCRLSPVR